MPAKIFRSRFAPGILVLLAGAVALTLPTQARDETRRAAAHVRLLKIRYRAHDGAWRAAYVILPAGYDPRGDWPLPLIISPHGRGVSARSNARLWGNLPAAGPFAVVCPEGEGRRLPLFSWGYSGQVADLARMPAIVAARLPWLRIASDEIYAFGGSMGGQEVLLLAARYPHLLAGAAAFDSIADFSRQYRNFLKIPCNRRCFAGWKGPIGVGLQSLARVEVGGSPKQSPLAYARRSPLTYARALAESGVPLQIWWSRKDRIVPDQAHQSALLVREIKHANRDAPVESYIGFWTHSAEMRATTFLPRALRAFLLLP